MWFGADGIIYPSVRMPQFLDARPDRMVPFVQGFTARSRFRHRPDLIFAGR
jgi:hypothetical protein